MTALAWWKAHFVTQKAGTMIAPADDDFIQAVSDVARELDRGRTWRERLRDAVLSIRLFFDLLKTRIRR